MSNIIEPSHILDKFKKQIKNFGDIKINCELSTAEQIKPINKRYYSSDEINHLVGNANPIYFGDHILYSGNGFILVINKFRI